MAEFLQITTTAGTRQDAEQIAEALVWRRLAACVQVSGPIQSTYRWQGQVETAQEWMCTAKTGRDQLAAIETLLGEIHKYEVPELIATPIIGGNEKYLAWLAEQLR
jgi:periplasmic divalent cation tolerance protein